MDNFKNSRARVDFWLFAAATFALFTTYSMLALLSIVLQRHGLSADRIGIVLAAPTPSILITMLLAGPVVTRFGALQVARAGALIILLSYLSFELTNGSFLGAIVSRIALGMGYASFIPAAMIYADSNLIGPRKVYYFGIYASMAPLPNIIGPLLGETYLERIGLDQFFVYTAFPALLGSAIVFFLRPAARTEVRRAALSDYVQLLRQRSLWMPYGGIFTVGMFYGFVTSFMALLLESRRIPVSYFFVTFTVCLFGTRFLLIRYIQQLSRVTLFSAVLGLLSCSYLLLAFSTSPVTVTLSGILYGLGYSIAYPTFSNWVTQQFVADKRGMPLTLYNAVFTLGIFVLPLVGGFVIAWLGAKTMVLGMGFGALIVLVSVWSTYRATRRTASDDGSDPLETAPAGPPDRAGK